MIAERKLRRKSNFVRQDIPKIKSEKERYRSWLEKKRKAAPGEKREKNGGSYRGARRERSERLR